MIEFTLKSGEIYDSNMGENYIEALNEAIAEYNQGGAIQEIPDNDGNIQYVKFDLSSTSEANGNYGFRDINGNWAYYSVNVRVNSSLKN